MFVRTSKHKLQINKNDFSGMRPIRFIPLYGTGTNIKGVTKLSVAEGDQKWILSCQIYKLAQPSEWKFGDSLFNT